MRGAALAVAAMLLAVPASASALEIRYSVSGTPGDNGWYVGPVTVTWTVNAPVANCPPVTQTNDTASWSPSCMAGDGVSESYTKSVYPPIQIDRTPPTGIIAAPARPPDSGSWYTSPVTISWSGSDAMSKGVSCTTMTYAAPDASAAAPSGTCRDAAGNLSVPVPFTLSYDATPPALTGVTAMPGRGKALLHFAAGADVARLTVMRSPGNGDAASTTLLDGPAPPGTLSDRGLVNGVRYMYSLIARDAAGNGTSAKVAVMPGSSARKGGAKILSAGSLVRWQSTPRARYYNFQLLRSGRKLLSTWPATSRYRLRPQWRFGGRMHRLSKGTYAWYVWPGFGQRSARRYGKLAAHGSFVVR